MLDVFTGALDTKTVLVEDGLIHGFGSEPAKETFEAKGAVLLPSLIDSNVHIESPMLSPASFASLVLPFGTTTVTAAPSFPPVISNAPTISEITVISVEKAPIPEL